MRILVTSFLFPPFNCIGSVRVGKTVKYLLKFGHDVRVVTAKDQPFKPTLPVECPAQNIIYTKWINLRRPVELTRQEKAADATKNNLPQRGRLSAMLKSAFTLTYRTLFYFPDADIGWLPQALKASSRIIEEWRPDVILASSPPYTPLIVAHRLSRKYGIPWVADLRDLWIDHPYYEHLAWRKALEERLERRVLSSADGLVTVSEPLAQTLKTKYGKDAAVVLNGFDPEDYPPCEKAYGDNGQLRILYTGMIYPGKRDPSPLFDALRRLGPLAERVRVLFYGSYLDTARELARRYEVERLVEINDPVPYKDSLRMQREADILLLLLWTDPTERGVFTGKLFEYIGARRPVLAIGGEQTVAADLIRERRVGAVLTDPALIAGQLEAWIKEKQEKGAVPALGDDAVEGISREEQTRVLEQYLFRITGSAR